MKHLASCEVKFDSDTPFGRMTELGSFCEFVGNILLMLFFLILGVTICVGESTEPRFAPCEIKD